MKKPITIGVIAVIATILVTSAIDFSADAIKPQPAPEKTELTALMMSSSTGGEAIFNNISPAGDETFNVSTFCENCSASFIVRTSGGMVMFDGKSWAGTLSDGNFELKGILNDDDTGNGYVPSSFTLSGSCGENSNVSLETDSGWSGSFTANVACV